ncbi:hypothetical protein CAPTEDRAFT_186612 [Capitella teleta]|uniref:Endonuclease/exonuclease/phosphatase domain-containing protein n=1 Tax=Capitella teleta TaxID=283909 RepID=R7TAM5_CAPTE|nr:hypothetical protein CAPTEDRAFT_186612 [Capitella teleta]|eukprot:ELT90552.1 hypothetical protein CAPTEDRAFT_186612 [Capitella teleta]
MDLPLLSEINTMKKEDLKNTLLDLIDYVKNAKKNDSVMLQILEEVKKGSNEREGLKEEMTQLKSNNEVLLKELADVKSHLSALHLHQQPTMENDSSPPPFFADAVKKSVHTALPEDKAKCDIIISKVEEKGKDDSFAADLCSKISYDTKPIGVMRLGRKKEDTHHHRLLKLSFSTNFEARAFRSHFEEARKDKPNDLSEFRVRPSRNREDQAAFRKSAIVTNTLNKEAKHEGDMCSYSYSWSICPWSHLHKAEDINDFIIEYNIDILAITETWLTGTACDGPTINALLPNGYEIIHAPRRTRGGGTALVYRQSLNVTRVAVSSASFEVLECVIKGPIVLRICVVYQPYRTALFMEEFSSYLAGLATSPGHLLVLGDFNLHVDDPLDKCAQDFLTSMSSLGLEQHVTTLTHRNGHTLDLVLTPIGNPLDLTWKSIDSQHVPCIVLLKFHYCCPSFMEPTTL